MDEVGQLDAKPLAERFVLLGVTDLYLRDETPAHSVEVMRACEQHLDALDGAVVGRVTEADIMRAMNALAAEGLLSQTDVVDRSAVGKGRPAYTLGVEVTALLDSLEADDRLAPLLETVGEANAP
jgi:hypothetical protein